MPIKRIVLHTSDPVRNIEFQTGITNPLIYLYEVTGITENFFISTWDTEAYGGNTPIVLPLYDGGLYDFNVDWGDTTTSHIVEWDQVETTHQYLIGGVYTVKIIGVIIGWCNVNAYEDETLIEISNWGPLKIGNSGYSFNHNWKLICTATDKLDISGVTNMNSMFYQSFLFNQDISNWNVENVTSMSYMFGYTNSFTSDITNWNVGNVTDMSYMFISNDIFNQDISNWNVGNVTNMSNMFYDSVFNQDISNWDISNVTDMSYMFYNSALSNANYSNILIGWAAKTVKPNVTLDVGTIKYNSSAVTARGILTSSPNNWIINDGGVE